MVNTSLIKSKYIESLTNHEDGLTFSSFDREYGIKIEVKGYYRNLTDTEPSSNCVVVYLYEDSTNEWSSESLFKEVASPDKAVALGNLIQAFYGNKNLDYQKVVKLCKSQGLN